MNIRESILSWYHRNNIPYRLSGNRLISICPLHDGADNPSAFNIDLETGKYKCWTHNCSHVHPARFFGFNSPNSKGEKYVYTPPPEVQYSTEYLKTCIIEEGYLKLYKPVYGKYKDYIKNRGFDDNDIERFEIYCCDDPDSYDYDRIILPIRDKQGRLRNFCCRHIDPPDDTPKYLYYAKPRLNLFYNMSEYDPRYPIVICEGIFDCMSLIKSGVKNAWSPFSLHLSREQIKYLLRPSVMGVIFAMDNMELDNASNQIIESLIKKISEQAPEKYYGLMVSKGFKDWNEGLINNLNIDKIYKNGIRCMKQGKNLF